jgi:hypothetical protein
LNAIDCIGAGAAIGEMLRCPPHVLIGLGGEAVAAGPPGLINNGGAICALTERCACGRVWRLRPLAA